MTAIKDLTTGFGKIEYNGFVFGPFRQVKVETTPIYDESDRVLILMKYNLTVTAVIQGSEAGVSTLTKHQERMETIQDALNVSGGRLIIEDIGLDQNIDTAFTGSTPDIDFGPKPRLMSLSPLGGAIGWQVVWTVEFTISRCFDTSLSVFFTAFNYETVYSTNDEGLVTRTISGYFTLAGVKSPIGTGGTFSVEDAWRRIQFTVPECFRRVNATRQISSNKMRMDFSVTDEEYANLPYQDFIVEADVEQGFDSIPPGFASWSGTISGSLTVAPGFPPSLAAQKFFIIMFTVAADLNAAAAINNGVVIPERISLRSQKFGRTSNFNVTFRFVGCLREIITSSGLYRSVPGTSYQSWRASMITAGVFSSSGRGNWGQNLNEDFLIDFCDRASFAVIGNDNGTCQQSDTGYSQPMGCDNITEEKSWLHHTNSIRGIQRNNNTLHRLAQFFAPVALASLPTNVGVLGAVMALGHGSNSSARDHINQYNGAGDNFILMRGSALRMRFVPETPNLKEVGGVEVEELARNIDLKPVGYFFGCTLFALRWAILYRVKGQMTHIEPARNNKTLCFTEGEKTLSLT